MPLRQAGFFLFFLQVNCQNQDFLLLVCLYPNNPNILSEICCDGARTLKKHLLYMQKHIQGASLG